MTSTPPAGPGSREGSWAPLLGAVALAVLSLVFIAFMSGRGGGNSDGPASPAPTVTPGGSAPTGALP